MISPEILRRFSLFAGLESESIKQLAMLAKEDTYPKGEWLFFESDAADTLYVVIEGKVDLKVALDEEGNNYADIQTIVEGEVTGWSAMVEPYEYKLDGIAATDVRLAAIDGVGLRELMQQDTKLGYILMSRLAKEMAERLTNMRIRFISLI